MKKSQLEVDKDKEDVNIVHYLKQLSFAPGVQHLLGEATFKGDVRSAGDYSYSAEMNHYAGPHYRIAGDAGGKLEYFVASQLYLSTEYQTKPSLTLFSHRGFTWHSLEA